MATVGHLPPCSPDKPKNWQLTFKSETVVWENCAFTLDGLNEPLRRVTIISRNCVIHYSGGTIVLLGRIELQNCILDFHIGTEPPPGAANLVAGLLASNLTHTDTTSVLAQ
jgi:hypothetical protein